MIQGCKNRALGPITSMRNDNGTAALLLVVVMEDGERVPLAERVLSDRISAEGLKLEGEVETDRVI